MKVGSIESRKMKESLSIMAIQQMMDSGDIPFKITQLLVHITLNLIILMDRVQ